MTSARPRLFSPDCAASRAPSRCSCLLAYRDNAALAMPAILSEHGVNAELHVLPIGSGAFGATLLIKAHELGADMLMMGAYVHSPLRQLLFGGVTRYMLSHADSGADAALTSRVHQRRMVGVEFVLGHAVNVEYLGRAELRRRAIEHDAS